MPEKVVKEKILCYAVRDDRLLVFRQLLLKTGLDPGPGQEHPAL